MLLILVLQTISVFCNWFFFQNGNCDTDFVMKQSVELQEAVNSEKHFKENVCKDDDNFVIPLNPVDPLECALHRQDDTGSTLEEGESHKVHHCNYSASPPLHKSGVHHIEKIFKCSHCNYATPIKARLIRHFVDVHVEVKPIKRTLRSYSASHKRTRDDHATSIYSREKQIKL